MKRFEVWLARLDPAEGLVSRTFADFQCRMGLKESQRFMNSCR